MTDAAPTETTLYASPGMRRLAIMVLCAVGGALTVQSIGGQGAVLLLVPAAGAFWVARQIWQSDVAGVVLRPDGLWDTQGRLIATIDNIASVNRGIFAFKPPNGFTLRLRTRMQVAWVPGLYWRWGTWVGVGGITPQHPAKQMALAVEHAVQSAA